MHLQGLHIRLTCARPLSEGLPGCCRTRSAVILAFDSSVDAGDALLEPLELSDIQINLLE